MWVNGNPDFAKKPKGGGVSRGVKTGVGAVLARTRVLMSPGIGFHSSMRAERGSA